MDKPIERTVVWDHLKRCWRDKVTGIEAANMSQPMIDGGVPWDYHGSGSYLDAPSQPSNEEPSDLRDVVREIARSEALHVLAGATIPQFPAYFVEKHWLVTYEWAKYLTDLAEQRAFDRVKRSFPRWLRWLIR